MELAELLIQLKRNFKLLIITSVICGLFGILLYFAIPQHYVASGSFYISRKMDSIDSGFFSYEGYYGQQTALSYTSTVLGLFESTDIKSQALKSLNIEVNNNTLRKLKRDMSVKKLAPQVVFVSVKATSESYAGELFQAVADATINTSNDLNIAGDAHLQIKQVSKPPVVSNEFRNIYVNMLIGLGLGFILGLVLASLKKHLEKAIS